MDFKPTLFACISHILVLHTLLLYKGTHVYFILYEMQYYLFSISNMVLEPLL